MEPLSPVVPAAESAPAPSGFTPVHAVGGSLAAVVGAVVVAVANHFGYHLSDPDALLVGGAVVSTGVAFAHVISQVGVVGAFKRVLHGGA